MLTCSKCNKQFAYQSILNRHLNKKNGCGVITNTIAKEENKQNKGIKIFTKINYLKGKVKKLDIINDDVKCGYCKKIFSTKGNLKSHILNRCKNKISIWLEKPLILRLALNESLEKGNYEEESLDDGGLD